MKIKIDYLRAITKEIQSKERSLASLMDKYEVVADERDIKNLAEELRYFADLVESITVE